MAGSKNGFGRKVQHPIILPAGGAIAVVARHPRVSNGREVSFKRLIFTDDKCALTLTLLLLIATYLFTSFAAYNQRLRLDRLIDSDLVFHGIATPGVQQREDPRISNERRRLQPLLQTGNKTISAENPLRIVIITTWRAGSTFLGQLLSSHPGAFYQHEPLFGYLPLRARSSAKGRQKGIQAVRDLLNCRYDFFPESYFEEKRVNSERELHKNERLRKVCHDDGFSSQGSTDLTLSKTAAAKEALPSCFSADFLSRLCSLYPIRVLKEVRLPVSSARDLLEDSSGIKVIFLVRDPRGVMESRRHVPWCKGAPDVEADVASDEAAVTSLSSKDRPSCSTAKYLCDEMFEDYGDAQKLVKLYPKNFRVVRYEDLTTNLERTVPDLFRFIDMPIAKETAIYLETHTRDEGKNQPVEQRSDAWAKMVRDTKSNPIKWTKLLSQTAVQNVERHCHEVMKLFGYKEVGGFLHENETLVQVDDVVHIDFKFAAQV